MISELVLIRPAMPATRRKSPRVDAAAAAAKENNNDDGEPNSSELSVPDTNESDSDFELTRA